jgi:voltage-gated potassium channel
MRGRRRVRTGLVILGGLAIIGTAWFWLVEHYALLDAAYQTTTTITTVGFGEVRPFDASARAFSILLMVFGVGAAFYTLGGVFEELVEDSLVRFGRRRMDRRIESLSGHVIVCGFGRVGNRIAQVLTARELDLVVIDVNDEQCEQAAQDGFLTVRGDSTEDDVLRTAGIERASTLVVSLASDADAISTVLSARVLGPRLRIVARANAESSEAKLERAGVDHIVNPLSHGAQRMAAFAEQPAVADFLDVVAHEGSQDYQLEEVRVPARSPIAGVTLGEARLRARTGALVLALRRADGTFLSNPGPGVVLEPEVTLIAIGTAEQTAALEQHVAGGGKPVPAPPD